MRLKYIDPGLCGNGVAHAAFLVALISEGGVSATPATCSYQCLVDQEKCLYSRLLPLGILKVMFHPRLKGKHVAQLPRELQDG